MIHLLTRALSSIVGVGGMHFVTGIFKSSSFAAFSSSGVYGARWGDVEASCLKLVAATGRAGKSVVKHMPPVLTYARFFSFVSFDRFVILE